MDNYKKILTKAVLKKFGPDQEQLDEWYGKYTNARRLYLRKLWLSSPKCIYCSRETISPDVSSNSGLRATYEHLTPLSRGGTDKRSNAGLACRRCNNLKGSNTHEEFIESINTGKLVEKIKLSRMSKKHKKIESNFSPLNEKQAVRNSKISFMISFLMFNNDVKNLVMNIITDSEMKLQLIKERLDKKDDILNHVTEVYSNGNMGY